MNHTMRKSNKRNYALKIECLIFAISLMTYCYCQDEKDSLVFKNMIVTEYSDTLPDFISDSLKIVNYMDAEGSEISQIGFYKDGSLCYYSIGNDMQFYYSSGLGYAKWYGGKVISFTFFGPGLSLYIWNEFSNGNVEIWERDSSGYGTGYTSSPDGRILVKEIIKPIYSEVTTYYSNGKIKEEYSHLFYGKIKIGDYVQYSEKGKIILIGKYLSYQELLDNGYEITNLFEGVKDGQWRYMENGKVIKVEIWENGKLIVE